jgi:hypothetical protein
MTRRDLGRLMTGALTAAVTPPAISAPSTRNIAERRRRDFPALRHSAARKQRVYLDSAATAQRPTAVLNALREFYERDTPTLARLNTRRRDGPMRNTKRRAKHSLVS